jgi:TRAP-type mannitol/chloroaromatic compound transport system permease large subunit
LALPPRRSRRLVKGRLTACKVMEDTLRKTLLVSCMFMWIILAALCFGAVFDGLGAVKSIEYLFVERLDLSPWEVLILMQLSYIIMGMFLDDTAMLVIVAPLYVPLVGLLGFDLVWYGVLYTITCQIAYMTPPFGYNLFLMRAMAPPEMTIGDIYRLDHPVRAGHDACACACDGFPGHRSLAAQPVLWPVSEILKGWNR